MTNKWSNTCLKCMEHRDPPVFTDPIANEREVNMREMGDNYNIDAPLSKLINKKESPDEIGYDTNDDRHLKA